MEQSIKGTYESGRIQLDRLPQGITRARVEVIFPEDASNGPRKSVMRLGMFRKDGSKMSSWEDFMDAKKSLNPREI